MAESATASAPSHRFLLNEVAWVVDEDFLKDCSVNERVHPDVAPRIADHDALFTSIDGEPLSRDRCSTIVRDCMRRAGIPRAFTPHSLRNAVNNMLTLRGVSHEDICVRAGWASTASSSRARIKHYNHFRLVAPNMARVLLLGVTVPGTVIQPGAAASLERRIMSSASNTSDDA